MDGIDGDINVADEAGDAFGKIFPPGNIPGAVLESQPFQVQFQDGKHLSELIVDFARDTEALLFARGFDAGGELAQSMTGGL